MWVVDLLTQPSCLQVILILSAVCALGVSLGSIKIKEISLGITLVFFVGIFAGDLLHRLDVQTDWKMISLAQNFGLIIFVYALGVQVGPGFFTSLKKGGIKLNLFGMLTILTTTLTAAAASLLPAVSFPESIGLLCGAATNTPMLGAAQQTLLDLHPEQTVTANSMASACAVGYPIGVLGVLISTIILKKTYRGKSISSKSEPSGDTYVAEFHVSNPAIFGLTIAEAMKMSGKQMIISRIWNNGVVTIPTSTTVLEKDAHLLAVLGKADLQTFLSLFGEQDPTDWNRPDIDWNNIDGSGLVSRHILVTRKELNGVKIGSLHLRNTLNINITRVSRAGIQLVAYPGLRLQMGDRLTVVGDASNIDKVSDILGNTLKELRVPNLMTIFLGIMLGIVLGSIPIYFPGISIPVKLGIAGGPIVVGILMGAFGPRIHLSTYSTRSANMMIRQLGIVIYLACLGMSAGAGFVETVFCLRGLVWLGISFVIATVPVLICGFIARKSGELDYSQNAGMLCAAMANPMALSYANSNGDENEASEAYATVYPLSMFIRVISAQILILLAG